MSRWDRAFGWILSVFVYITVVLPSGSIYGIDFKYPIYACLLPLAVRTMFRKGLASAGVLCMMLGVPCLLSVWVIIGILYGFPLTASVRQYISVLMSMLMCWLAFVYTAKEDVGKLRFLRLSLNASLATALFKIALIAYALVRGIPTIELVASISEVFGVDLMTMDLGALFGRIQFVSDGLIPVSVYIIMRHRNRLRLGPLRAAMSILLLMTSVVFSFSRYFWGFTVVAFLLGLLLGKRDRFQGVLAAILTVSVLISLPSLTTLFELRFSEEVAGGSDQARTEQAVALREFFKGAPLFGHGFGSYSTQVVRVTEGDSNSNYSYEEQLPALCGQMGLAGMTMLALVALFYYRDLWWKSRLRAADRIGITALILCWLASGFYNPLLLSPIAGINYAAFAMLSGLGEKQEETGEQGLIDLRDVSNAKGALA